MLTLGSITADATYGGNDTVPELIRDRRDGGWALWETLAKKAKDFGRPNTFDGNIDENKWESFTLTMHGDLLLKRIIAYSGNEPGTGGADDLRRFRLADVDRRAASAAFSRYAGRHLHALGVRPFHRRGRRLRQKADGEMRRARRS